MSLEIKKLSSEYSSDLALLMSSDSEKYLKYFVPFEFDEATLNNILSQAIKDHFYGLFYEHKLIGFYMLRGLDQGYSIPSYGVYVNEEFQGKGLGMLTLKHAISVSKLIGCKKLMLKVHPEHIVAKKLYLSQGFNFVEIDQKNDNLIMIKEI